VAVDGGDGGVDRGDGLAAAVPDQRHRPHPRRLDLQTRHDSDAAVEEEDPQAVRAVRRLPRAVDVRERRVMPPRHTVLVVGDLLPND